jgi:uncharacterized protein (DUF608 family)
MSLAGTFVYEGERTREISFPLGGIGTGSIGLSGAGRLIDWEILNRPNKGSTNGISHFAVRAERNGAVLDARILNGPYRGNRTGDFTGAFSRNFGFGVRRDSLAAMPHFASCRFEGRFPIARLEFADAHFPGGVALQAFNPFIPLNDRDSSMPVAMFEVTLSNTTDAPIDYSVIGVLGHGLERPTAVRKLAGPISGVAITTDGRDADAPDYAELVLATDAPVSSGQSHLYRGLWFDALEVYWRDLQRPGPLRERSYATADAGGGMRRDRDCSLHAAHISVAPGESGRVRFVIAWYAPNFSKYWISAIWHFRQPSGASGCWKNWYATEWSGAEAIATEALGGWDRLAAGTACFRDALYGSTLPHAVLDAAGANLSILKSPTTVRLTDGTFYGFEGCHPTAGSCEGSCTHVWNYQQALPFLFPALERSMREADYTHNMNPAGGMSFRLGLPIGAELSTERACADGQFGNVMKLYRDWKLCGDDAWLRRLWPLVKRSIEFAWHPANPDRWDPERTGVLWGRQHHTLDMELFGPNAWLSGFYIGALMAGAAMADAMGEPATAASWHAMAEAGRRFVEQHLFNGSYFIQQIDLGDRSVLDPYAGAALSRRLMDGDVYDQYWSEEHEEIKYQAGEGCLIDQVVADWHARLYGLGAVFDPAKVTSSLRAIWRHNFKERLGDCYNPCRVFGLDDESGTLIAAWPEGARKPAVPVPYAQETFHGTEYAFGGSLMQHGMLREGVRAFGAVRDRYDGANRNPWNEIECGSNYARSMASWCGVLAVAGFAFDAHRRHIGFDPLLRDGLAFRAFWCNGQAWGTVALEQGNCLLTVLGGAAQLASIGLPLPADAAAAVALNGADVAATAAEGVVRLASPLKLGPGDVLHVAAPFDIARLPDVAAL